jgi:hypothetical protein
MEDVASEFDRKMAEYEMKLKLWTDLNKKKEDAKGRAKQQFKPGRKPTRPKIADYGPMRSEKGGVDWYRYQNELLCPILLPDFEKFQQERLGRY